MSAVWRVLRQEGPLTVIEVMIEPGRVAEVPVRNDQVGSPIMEAMVDEIIRRHVATQDVLGDFT